MKYISGLYALNVPCSLKTTGDWHYKSYPINKAKYNESDNSIYKDYGIENYEKDNIKYNVANHLRAILDLMVDNRLDQLKGFKNDYIVVSDYDNMFFDKVYEMKTLKNWQDIDDLMGSEYMLKWLQYKKEKEYGSKNA